MKSIVAALVLVTSVAWADFVPVPATRPLTRPDPSVANDSTVSTSALPTTASPRRRRRTPMRCAEPPTDASELTRYSEEGSEITSSVAASMSFPILSGSGAASDRFYVFDYANYAECDDEQGRGRLRYGVSVRLLISVSDFQLDSRISLPVIAASTELGRSRAQYRLLVTGANSPAIPPLLPAIGTYNIESHVELLDAVRRIKEVLSRPDTRIEPAVIAIERAHALEFAEYRRTVATTWALQSIRDGVACERALMRAQSLELDGVEVQSVYTHFDTRCGADKPTDDAQRRATDILGDLRIRG